MQCACNLIIVVIFMFMHYRERRNDFKALGSRYCISIYVIVILLRFSFFIVRNLSQTGVYDSTMRQSLIKVSGKCETKLEIANEP